MERTLPRSASRARRHRKLDMSDNLSIRLAQPPTPHGGRTVNSVLLTLVAFEELLKQLRLANSARLRIASNSFSPDEGQMIERKHRL